MSKNTCYTYFAIIGHFDPEAASVLLGIAPDKIVKEGELLRNGRRSSESSLRLCTCDVYDVYTENQMRATVAPLLDKVGILNKLRAENEVSMYLEIVPSICADEPTPCLAPPSDVMEFCLATRTEIDIDLYVI